MPILFFVLSLLFVLALALGVTWFIHGQIPIGITQKVTLDFDNVIISTSIGFETVCINSLYQPTKQQIEDEKKKQYIKAKEINKRING